jgi:hypothetical protein
MQFRGKDQVDVSRPHANYHSREDSSFTPERIEFGKRYAKLTETWEDQMYPDNTYTTFGQ